MKSFFEVDVKGLRSLLGEKSKTFLVNELVQNAWDENITKCKLDITQEGRGKVQIRVEDDSPEGFRDITHAYTLFSDTYKRRDTTKRGRFNLGEKLVLAVCFNYGAEISTTKGTIEFHPKKGRINHRTKREKGTVFTGTFRATKAEYQELMEHVNLLIPPEGITFIVNGSKVVAKPIFKKFNANLATEIYDDETGFMKPTKRNTYVHLLEHDNQSYIYEMGIPIAAIECKWHIDVQQKIPLTLDRSEVKPSYLQDIYAEVLNHTYDDIEDEEASDSWVRDGFSDSKRIEKKAVDTVLKKRFGDKFLAKTPNDPVANDDSLAHGYHNVSGSELSKDEWDSIKKHDGMKSTHEKFGTEYRFGDYDCIEPTEKQRVMIDFIKKIARDFLDINNLKVELVEQDIIGRGRIADYSPGQLRIASRRIGVSKLTYRNLDLIIHELCHHYGNHTEIGYLREITSLGAQLTFKALDEPRYFDEVKHDD